MANLWNQAAASRPVSVVAAYSGPRCRFPLRLPMRDHTPELRSGPVQCSHRTGGWRAKSHP